MFNDLCSITLSMFNYFCFITLFKFNINV